jgi:hypothetical protein
MPNSDPRHRLLADILSDDTFIAHRQRLLAESERCLRHRRQVRSLRRLLIPLVASLAVAATLARWWMIHGNESSTPHALPALADHRPVKELIVVPATMESISVSTVDILRTPSIPYTEFSTLQVPAGLQVISDQELLAIFANRGVLLLGRGNSKELWLLQEGRLQAVH